MTEQRRSGLLMAISSLPSEWGIGDFGPGAFDFIEFLKDSGQSCWQILPLSVTDNFTGNSPYNSPSAFAISPNYINPGLLFSDGLLEEEDLHEVPDFPAGKVDFNKVAKFKNRLFDRAFDLFREQQRDKGSDFEGFCSQNAYWLDNYCLFQALKQKFELKAWQEWPAEFRDRKDSAMEEAAAEMDNTIFYHKFIQYTANLQWDRIRRKCSEKGIELIGDIPIYVSLDSADVWSSRENFQLNHQGFPTEVGGVPPDYFSETGQLWGNPLYDWNILLFNNFNWWKERIKRNLNLCDTIRIDHFRGLVKYWAIPAVNENAIEGRWRDVPVMELFNSLREDFGDLPLLAENLGTITPDVTEAIENLGLPGMLVLQFAFNESFPTNPYAPHNHSRNNFVYPGTHDNATAKEWFLKEAGDEGIKIMSAYLGKKIEENSVHLDMVRLALNSVARTSIVTLQDILGLGEEARMNTPSRRSANWDWRHDGNLPDNSTRERLREMTRLSGRLY